VTFDVLFTEASEVPEHDVALQQAEIGAKTAASPERPHFLTDGSRFGLQVKDWALVKGLLPIAPFAPMEAGYGAVNAVPDADGVLRSVLAAA
jgi:hypothetical protein